MENLLMGMVAMGFFVAGLHFHRFWMETKDRFFMFFTLAFYTLGVNRILLVWIAGDHEQVDVVYWIRFAAFLMIILGIVDKNLAKSGRNLVDTEQP